MFPIAISPSSLSNSSSPWVADLRTNFSASIKSSGIPSSVFSVRASPQTVGSRKPAAAANGENLASLGNRTAKALFQVKFHFACQTTQVSVSRFQREMGEVSDQVLLGWHNQRQRHCVTLKCFCMVSKGQQVISDSSQLHPLTWQETIPTYFICNLYQKILHLKKVWNHLKPPVDGRAVQGWGIWVQVGSAQCKSNMCL